ncbi:hypothetical protein POTOM_054914 [Populus tomentosa]|uniref:Uncharacterized protein n=1 Tax=Populus tomentosa TaxID=118781 RepID=A0A8X8C6R1_POPTO|nr:hypothetical protein POTOM_054914 [Populus tomentosa]
MLIFVCAFDGLHDLIRQCLTYITKQETRCFDHCSRSISYMLKEVKSVQSKGDGTNAESRAEEENFLIQDEISKSCLVSIMREEETILHERDNLF